MTTIQGVWALASEAHMRAYGTPLIGIAPDERGVICSRSPRLYELLNGLYEAEAAAAAGTEARNAIRRVIDALAPLAEMNDDTEDAYYVLRGPRS